MEAAQPQEQPSETLVKRVRRIRNPPERYVDEAHLDMLIGDIPPEEMHFALFDEGVGTSPIAKEPGDENEDRIDRAVLAELERGTPLIVPDDDDDGEGGHNNSDSEYQPSGGESDSAADSEGEVETRDGGSGAAEEEEEESDEDIQALAEEARELAQEAVAAGLLVDPSLVAGTVVRPATPAP